MFDKLDKIISLVEESVKELPISEFTWTQNGTQYYLCRAFSEREFVLKGLYFPDCVAGNIAAQIKEDAAQHV